MRRIFQKLDRDDLNHDHLISWIRNREIFSVFYNNERKDPELGQSWNMLAGIEKVKNIEIQNILSFEKKSTEEYDYAMGYLCYDLKNEIETHLSSSNFDGIQLPDSCFFQPRFILLVEKGVLNIGYLPEFDDEQSVKQLFTEIINFKEEESTTDKIHIKPRVSKEEYIENLIKIREHIHRGDIYEMNYCIEFYAENVIIDPSQIFNRLNKLSEAPFAAFCRFKDTYLLCSSPERFIKKAGNKIISQPIKGTIKRGKNKEEDERLRERLRTSKKEQSENVMIVDLVRNDLSKIAARASVKVDELFGIYSFKQVHQMISTISAELKEEVSFREIVKALFPPGSMTGAPKVKAMELIEKYESTKRGLYSGSVGYFTPEGDFDLNVVIRSIIYNSKKKYLSVMVGSAITDQSDPQLEYEECLLKAKGMLEALNADIDPIFNM